MFAIVEMNGCILNLAIKKPAMDAKVVVSNTHTNNARIARGRCRNTGEIKDMSEYSTCIYTIMHNDSRCYHTKTNHSSY